MCTNIYYAPLEGITGYIYRNAFHDIIECKKSGAPKKIEKYFAPFISPSANQPLSRKEIRDILPENNGGIPLVPQLLGNSAESIITGMEAARTLGYSEVNINLGCPSGTVVAKKKGAGLLSYPDELDELLYRVYDRAEAGGMRVSVKTRTGRENAEEFYALLDIYNKYHMQELIIHPRLQKDFYKNTPNMEMFDYAVKHSKNRLCYNGDIISVQDYDRILKEYAGMKLCGGDGENALSSVMIGRGFLRNPMLIYELMVYQKNATADTDATRDGAADVTKKALLSEFHDRLLDDYIEEMSGERPVLFKMKELWAYMGDMCAGQEKLLKKLRKTERIAQYKSIVQELMKSL